VSSAACPARSIPHHQPEPAAAAGLDASEGVLHHRRPHWRHPQPAGRLQEQRRVGLAGKAEPGGVGPVDLDVEQVADPV